MKIVQGKTFGVQKAAFGFDQILRDQLFRRMAIITRSHRVVTRFLPAIVLIVHDVAIFASRWVIRQIRCALAIPKRVRSGHDQQSAKNHEGLFQDPVPLGYQGALEMVSRDKRMFAAAL